MNDQLIEWNDQFRLGIAEIDHEHQEMIMLINKLHGSLSADAQVETVLASLGEIYSRIAAHFALEEKLMRDRNYPQFKTHKDDHETLLDQLLEIVEDLENGELVNYTEALSGTMNGWFSRHFQNEDARLHHFMNRAQ